MARLSSVGFPKEGTPTIYLVVDQHLPYYLMVMSVMFTMMYPLFRQTDVQFWELQTPCDHVLAYIFVIIPMILSLMVT